MDKYYKHDNKIFTVLDRKQVGVDYLALCVVQDATNNIIQGAEEIMFWYDPMKKEHLFGGHVDSKVVPLQQAMLNWQESFKENYTPAKTRKGKSNG